MRKNKLKTAVTAVTGIFGVVAAICILNEQNALMGIIAYCSGGLLVHLRYDLQGQEKNYEF